jgi:hypothetical protein
VTFKKIVFVGTPNHGSAIASPENLGQLIDRFTSFLSVVPPLGPVGTVTAVMTSVLEVVKVFGQGIEGGMPGLTDMAPESTLIATLDAPDTAESPVFFEIDANYEPAGSLLSLTHDADRIEDDLVFAKVANDVAVPSTGVGNVDPGTDPRFPIPEDQSHHYPAGNVWHCSYFDAEPTHQLLGSWLPT